MTTLEHPQHVAAGAAAGPRNLVICCDGTGNVLGNQHDTNVVKLARLCVNDAQQLVYYDPGVGTASDLPATETFGWLLSKLRLLSGLAFGRGIYENVSQAYEFLVHHYRTGDRIFLFGFSRGAFTVRCIAGLVHTYGIVRPCAMPLLPLMLRNYFAPVPTQEHVTQDPQRKTRLDFTEDVRAHFSDAVGRAAEVHFIGVWDTVASVGGLRSMSMSTQPTLLGRRYRHVRHAVSEGEYRAKYEPRLYEGTQREEPIGEGDSHQPSFKQKWFAGVHSDVGGSYEEAGLSDIALAWMLDELKRTSALEGAGLRLIPEAERPQLQPNPRAAAHDQALVSPLWALTGLQRRAAPDEECLDASLIERRASCTDVVESRLRFPRHSFFWISALACLASWALVVANTSWIGPVQLPALRLACLQLRAAWLSDSMRAAHSHGFGAALWCDTLLFIPAYISFACTLVVYAIRALRSFKPRSEKTHRLLRRLSMFGLLGTACGDLAENLFTQLFFTHAPETWLGIPLYGARSVSAVLLSEASAIKWLGLVTLFGLLSFAAGWAAFGSPQPSAAVARARGHRSPA